MKVLIQKKIGKGKNVVKEISPMTKSEKENSKNKSDSEGHSDEVMVVQSVLHHHHTSLSFKEFISWEETSEPTIISTS